LASVTSLYLLVSFVTAAAAAARLPLESVLPIVSRRRRALTIRGFLVSLIGFADLRPVDERIFASLTGCRNDIPLDSNYRRACGNRIIGICSAAPGLKLKSDNVPRFVLLNVDGEALCHERRK